MNWWSIILLVPTVSALYLACPNEEFIQPCSCRRIMSNLHIVCNKIEAEGTLSTPFRYLKNYDIGTLLLCNSNIHLHSDLFENVTVNTLKITNLRYKVTGKDSTFKGLDRHLSAVEFRKCDAVDFGDTTLSKMKKLREMVVLDSTLSVLRKSWFDGLETHFSLKVINSEVSSLEAGFLAEVANLHQVSLVGIQLDTISRSQFPSPAGELVSLDFRNNQLESLPEDMFTGMPNLKTVLLDGNSLSRLPSNVWLSIWDQLTTIGLENNRITCDRDILWMFEGTKHEKAEGQCAGPSLLVNAKIKAIQKRDIESANPLL